MAAGGENPFAALTAIAAPALLTNACSVLSLGTGNRMGRVVDRTRFITAALAAMPADSSQHSIFVREMKSLAARRELLLKALRLVYGALGAFAASALIAVTGTALAAFNEAFEIAAIVGFAVGACGVACLALGCSLMMRETRLAMDSLADEEKEFLHAHTPASR